MYDLTKDISVRKCKHFKKWDPISKQQLDILLGLGVVQVRNQLFLMGS